LNRITGGGSDVPADLRGGSSEPSGDRASSQRQSDTGCQLGTYYVEYHSLLPQVHMSQIAGLITSGVFDTFPELKVVVMEGGFTLPPI
jgi:predicted TIM-barrel fold metal-dependent hydrolase